MTTRPRVARDLDLFQGIVAILLFAVLVAPLLVASLGAPAGFGTDAPITASIGYALFNLQGGPSTVASESFLAAFEIIDVVLVAALVVAVMLARRRGDSPVRRLYGGDR